MNKLLIILIGIAAGTLLGDSIPRLYKTKSPTGIVRATEAEKQLTDTQIIANAKHPEQLMVIYTLESSQGKNDGCKRDGKFNGFGFRQNSREFKCYDTFQEVVTEVDNWLTEKEKLSYCVYNEGVARTDCPYAQTAMKLLEK